MKLGQVLSVFWLSISISGFAQWTWVNPKPQGNDLRAMAFSDTLNATAVGEFGIILRSKDGGGNWEVILSPTEKTLTSIYFVDENIGYAAGENGRILITKDGGDSWQVKESGFNSTINDLWFINEMKGFAVGPGTSLIETIDGGESWNIRQIGPNIELLSICFPSQDLGFISAKGGHIFRTKDGGFSWSIYSTGLNTPLSSVYFLDSLTGYCGSYDEGLFRTNNGGDSWFSTFVWFDEIKDVFFINKDTGFVLTNYDVLSTNDGGVLWKHTHLTGLSDYYYKSLCCNNQTVFFTGDYGTIYRTVNFGETWECVTSIESYTLRDPVFLNPDTGFLCSYKSVFRTLNGGNSWEEYEFRISYFLTGYGMYFLNLDTGFVTGDYGYYGRTVDGGLSWDTIQTEYNETFYNIYFITERVGFMQGKSHLLKSVDKGESWFSVFEGELNYRSDFRFFNQDTGYLFDSYGNCYYTYNGGTNWDSASGFPEGRMYFLNPDTGFIYSENGNIFRTIDHGMNWESQHLNVYDLYGVYFLDEKNGYTFGEEGIFFITSDCGETWQQQDMGTDNAFYWIIFPVSMTAYAGGQGGMIMKYRKQNTGIPEIDHSEHLIVKSFPNPSGENVTLAFDLENPSRVELRLFDISGRLILEDNYRILNSGHQQISFDCYALSPGTYFFNIKAGSVNGSGKIVLVRNF